MDTYDEEAPSTNHAGKLKRRYNLSVVCFPDAAQSKASNRLGDVSMRHQPIDLRVTGHTDLRSMHLRVTGVSKKKWGY
jgi:hypothetical protein